MNTIDILSKRIDDEPVFFLNFKRMRDDVDVIEIDNCELQVTEAHNYIIISKTDILDFIKKSIDSDAIELNILNLTRISNNIGRATRRGNGNTIIIDNTSFNSLFSSKPDHFQKIDDAHYKGLWYNFYISDQLNSEAIICYYGNTNIIANNMPADAGLSYCDHLDGAIKLFKIDSAENSLSKMKDYYQYVKFSKE